MENAFKYGAIALIVIPMLLMIVVAIFSAVLVLATIPKRDLREHSRRHRD